MSKAKKKTTKRPKLTAEQKEFRKKVSRYSAMANKRIDRLKDSIYRTSPAYNKWLNSGGEKFGIRGKTQLEVRREYYRVMEFLNSDTSTITGTKQVLTNIAKNTGFKYQKLEEVNANIGKFFELANKVEEYLKVTDRGASALGYQRIWEAINTFTEDNKIDLENVSIDDLIGDIANLAEGKLLDDSKQFTEEFFNTDWSNLK